MAEARAMARSEVYSRRKHSDYVSHTYKYTNNSLWQGGDSSAQMAVSFAKSVLKLIKARVHRMEMAIFNAVFPSTTFSWYGCVTASAIGYHYVPQFRAQLEGLPYLSLLPEGFPRWGGCSFVSGSLMWIGGIYASRFALKILLRYRGFLYEAPKKTSWQTLAWMFAVRILEGFGKPRTYSFQNVLPSLPVPPLSETCERYLESARPLLDDAEFDRMKRLAKDFQRNEGRVFQFWLKLKQLFVSNYVSDWWERFVYLRSRESLMINSNYYIMDAYSWTPTHQQAARAANLVHIMMKYKSRLDRSEIKPLLIQGTVPLCMSQHVRSFGTSRIPHPEEDYIQHVPESSHIAVLSRGNYYIISTKDAVGIRLSARDLEKQFQWILEDSKAHPSDTATQHLAAMTAAPRETWANFRHTFMGEGVTRASLEAIERAAFFVVLDEDAPENPAMKDWNQGNPLAKSLLHGRGDNRWFDKSITLVVFSNGKAGVNCEHTWADAPVAAHVWESALATEFASVGYDSSTGLNKAVPQKKTKPKDPLHLRFEFSEEAEAIILKSFKQAQQAIAELDHKLLLHDAYSKGFIKKCKVSPDAWLQMALQLAYYRDQGHFNQTYEASMTRLYRDGRTETVRPVSTQSCDFVLAMDDPSLTKKDRINLFNLATNNHVRLFRDAMSGKGIDRHLFCLYVVSKWKGVDSPFLKEVLSVPWFLSTSQTPVQQTDLFDLKNNLDKASAGGGFGPVTDDGYGVSYIVSSDSVVSFHVTCKATSKKTDSERFVNNIIKAMADIKELFQD